MDLGIPGFELIDTIGRGGSSVVYRASQTQLGRTVAIKILHASVTDPVLRSSFDKECRALGRLSNCDGVVTIFDAGWTTFDQPYLVMPYMSGGTLQDRLDKGIVLDVWQMMSMAEVLLTGLHQAHELGVIHRDLKPANVFLDEAGRPLLGDFGIASVAEMTASSTAAFSGTPLFAPPEAFAGRVADRRRDVYSAAATLRAAVTGHPPFTRSSGDLVAIMHAVVNADPLPIGAAVPASVVAVLDRAMAKDPAARPQTAADFLAELRAAVATAANSTIVREVPGFSAHVAEPVIAVMPPVEPTVLRDRSAPLVGGAIGVGAMGATASAAGTTAPYKRDGIAGIVVAGVLAVVGIIVAAVVVASSRGGGSNDTVASPTERATTTSAGTGSSTAAAPTGANSDAGAATTTAPQTQVLGAVVTNTSPGAAASASSGGATGGARQAVPSVVGGVETTVTTAQPVVTSGPDTGATTATIPNTAPSIGPTVPPATAATPAPTVPATSATVSPTVTVAPTVAPTSPTIVTPTPPPPTVVATLPLSMCPAGATGRNVPLKSSSAQPGASCSQIIYNFNDPGNYVEWTLPTTIARQSATISFHYLDGHGKAAPTRVIVGGVAQSVSFPTTVDWYSWATRNVTATVGPGMTIRVEWVGPTGSGDVIQDLTQASSLNFDVVTVRAA